MKLLAFSDVHNDLAACERLVQVARAESVDLVVGAGDFAVMRQRLRPTIEVLAQITQPLVLVAGNGESVEELRDACQAHSHIHVLHGSFLPWGGQVFFGLGYAVPETPFGAWSCDLSEADAAQLLATCPTNAILVSHSPPLGHVDRNSRGQSVGSRALLQTIQDRMPAVVLCGHVHDCWGQHSQIGATMVYNLGPSGKVLNLSPALGPVG